MRRLRLFQLILAAGCLGIGGGAAPGDAELSGGEAHRHRDPAVLGKARRPRSAECPGVERLLRCHARRAATVPRHRARTTGLSRSTGCTRCGSRSRSRRGRRARSRDELRNWLRPRVKLAWAERRLVDKVRGLSAPASPAVQQNRRAGSSSSTRTWDAALRQYDAATTVAQRQEALDKVNASLGALKEKNTAHPWVPSLTLQTALNDLYNQPSLDLSADLPTLTPFLSNDVVRNGPMYHKGYTSQVTAGAKTGFGLMSSDNGIAFYNSQMMWSVTPIWDFQKRSPPTPRDRGRRGCTSSVRRRRTMPS